MAKVRRPFDVVDPCSARSRREHRRRGELARRRAVNAAGLVRLEELLRDTASSRSPPSETSSSRHRRARSAELFDALLHEGVIVRPLAGFGAPTAIRVTVGHAGRARLLRRSARERPRAPVTAAAGTTSGFRRRAAVLRHDHFRLLFLATFGSGIGNWLALIALQADLYIRTNHSGWWISAVLVANILPAVAIGLLFGPLVDRLSRKGLMVTSDLGRLVVFARAAVRAAARRRSWRSPRWRGSATGSSGRPFSPACRTSSTTTSWRTPTRSCSSPTGRRPPLGPCSAALIVAASGPHLAYWLNAGTFAVSAAFVGWIPGQLLQSDARSAAATGGPRRRVPGHRPVAHPDAVLVAWTIAKVCVRLRQRRRDLPREALATTPASSASGCSGRPRASV